MLVYLGILYLPCIQDQEEGGPAYMLFHMGPQYIQVGRCKFLCDFLGCSLHIEHSHKDLHISHFDKPKLLDIQDQLSTHMAYILRMDYLCVQVDTCI